MRRLAGPLLLLVIVLASPSGAAAQRQRPVRITWLDDIPSAVKLARGKGVPVLLYVRDTFGEGFIDHVEERRDWGDESLRRQLGRTRARWRWQWCDKELFTHSDVAKAVEPFVRVRLRIGYRHLDGNARNMLQGLHVLTDIDLVWRWRLVEVPWDERGVFRSEAQGRSRIFLGGLNTTLADLLARERTCVVVLGTDGEPLLRFAEGPPGFEPPAEVLITELKNVLEPYRVLAEGRQHVKDQHISDAVDALRGLLRKPDALPREVREAAKAGLAHLVAETGQEIRELDLAAGREDVEAGRVVRVEVQWLDSMQQAIDLAHAKHVPILLYVRDTFGQEYVDRVEARGDWGKRSLRRHLERTGARWRWQRYDEDLFGRADIAKVVASFVRVRCSTGYRRLDDRTEHLLLRLAFLTDEDLVWRWDLVLEPWYLRYGQGRTAGRLKVTLDELLTRESTYVAVLAGNGQPLLRFPPDPPGTEPPAHVWVAELTRVLEPYRMLGEARRDLRRGHAKEAVETLRGLLQRQEGVPAEVREEAEEELARLTERADRVREKGEEEAR